MIAPITSMAAHTSIIIIIRIRITILIPISQAFYDNAKHAHVNSLLWWWWYLLLLWRFPQRTPLKVLPNIHPRFHPHPLFWLHIFVGILTLLCLIAPSAMVEDFQDGFFLRFWIRANLSLSLVWNGKQRTCEAGMEYWLTPGLSWDGMCQQSSDM